MKRDGFFQIYMVLGKGNKGASSIFKGAVKVPDHRI
jgi:hypothetical protein